MKSQFEKDFEAFEKELFADAEAVVGFKYDENGDVVEMTEEEARQLIGQLDTEAREPNE